MTRLETELLAPAGSIESLTAALENGADAIYFGLQTLNARQGAENFTLENLSETVELIQSSNARAFLTLNIDLTTRDVGSAARILTEAEEAGVDAVLFTDPAFLLLKSHFPNIEFHFSTQASITTTAGVKAAADLGISRVVLAREMSAPEIEAACKIKGVEVEVFTQGALCLCVSGRCLLSSWGGGKSGNRGACTSPCRVTWRVSSGNKEDILSTQDLSLIEKLPELVDAGVACLKIEGRLKNANWVGKAVKLYRDVLDKKEHHKQQDTLPLGEYSGREMTDGYYTGERHAVFGSGGRIASNNSFNGQAESQSSTSSIPTTPEIPASPVGIYNLSIMTGGKSLECEVEYDSHKENWTLPKTVIKHESRGLTITEAGGWLGQVTIQGSTLNEFSTDDADFLVSKKAVNKIADRISSSIHRARKKDQHANSKVTTLNDEVRQLTKFKERNTNNKYTPKTRPNTVRLNIAQANDFLNEIKPERVIVEDVTIADIPTLLTLCSESQLVIALPPVFFENDIPELEGLCQECAKKSIMVEVNGWDSWNIAKNSGASYSGGVGIAVLNPLAAEALQSIGFESISYSLEAGEKQLFDLSRSCPAESMLTVFARPVLAHTRADFSERLNQDTILRDSRGISLSVNFRGDVTELRSTKAFSIGGIDSPGIKARWICADMIGSPNPIGEWKNIHKKKSKEVFNFDKGLF